MDRLCVTSNYFFSENGFILTLPHLVCFAPQKLSKKKKEEVEFHFFLVASLLVCYEILFSLVLWALVGFFSRLEVQAIL